METRKEIASKLAKIEGNALTTVKINSIHVSEKTLSYGEHGSEANYVTMHIDTKVPGMVEGVDENGNKTYVRGMTTRLVTPTFSFSQVINENEDLCLIASRLFKKPQLLEKILVHATIEILMVEVDKDTTYTDPFYEDAEERVVANDSYFLHIVSIESFSKVSKMLIDRMVEAEMNASVEKMLSE